MEPESNIERFFSWLSEKTPCWLGGHIYSRHHKDGETIYLNGNGPLVEYTCEKCDKKEKFST